MGNLRVLYVVLVVVWVAALGLSAVCFFRAANDDAPNEGDNDAPYQWNGEIGYFDELDDVPLPEKVNRFDPQDEADMARIVAEILAIESLDRVLSRSEWREMWQRHGWNETRPFPESEAAETYVRVLKRTWDDATPKTVRAANHLVLNSVRHTRRFEPADVLLGSLLRRLVKRFPAWEPQVLGALCSSTRLLNDPEMVAWVQQRFADARPEDAALWGVIVVHAGSRWSKWRDTSELEARGYDCVRAAYDDALAIEQAGEDDLVAVPWFGVSVERVQREFRSSVLYWLQHDPAASTELLAHILAHEVHSEMLIRATRYLRDRSPVEPATLVALRNALRRNHRQCRLKALEIVREWQVAAECSSELRVLIQDPHKPIRSAARDLLEGLGEALPPVDLPAAPEWLVQELATLIESAWLDPVDATRAFVTLRFDDDYEATWLGWVPRNTPLPGFSCFTDEGRWVTPDSRLDGTLLAELPFVRPCSPEAETPEKEDSLESLLRNPPSGFFGVWVEGHAQQDWLRLAFACRLLEESNEAALRSEVDRLWRALTADFANDEDLRDALVHLIAWRHFDEMVHRFSRFEDPVSQWHAQQLLALESYAKPRTDIAEWMQGARLLQNEWRLRAELPDVEPPSDVPGRVRYWIARLPDVRVEQRSQPGSPRLVHGECRVTSEILTLGPAAIWPLVDAMAASSERVVRGYGYWRLFHPSRHFVKTNTAAVWLLEQVLGHAYGVVPPRETYKPAHRPQLAEWIRRRGGPPDPD